MLRGSRLFTILILLVVGTVVRAEKMDLDTHTAVIDRLSGIVKDLDDNDPSKAPSALRLADLLAERSRLKAQKEIEQNCTNCLKATEDRRQALGYYTYVLPRISGAQLSQALLQKAHLHYSLGEVNATEKMYKEIIAGGRKKHSGLVLGQAYAALGDVYFQKTEFQKAKDNYIAALAINETPQRGFVHFRLAWSLFNLDKVQEAIALLEKILQTPRLTEMVSDGVASQDETFKIDVSKDLATFYARTTINRPVINKLIALSPEKQRQENLFFLGTEADRLGKKKESAQVWLVYLENSGKDINALEAQIRLTKLKRDMGDLQGALTNFNHVRTLWEKTGCGDKCAALQGELRRWIIEWNKEEKKNQTQSLTIAYVTYTEMFPEDAEMFFWGAEVAQKRSQYREAMSLYGKAADVARKRLGDKLDEKEKKTMLTIFEGGLVGEIDMAETIKNHDARIKAYNHYLAINPKGVREFEVRYQIAQAEFEAKNYEKSANLFRNIAIEKNDSKKALQKTAANMSIESLIKLKREDLLEKWSLEFAQVFPKNQNEFYLIHRKAVLNTVAVKINQKTANESDLKKLSTVSLAGSTVQERISLNKSRYILAIRLQKFQEAKMANQNLLGMKELSEKDKQEAQTNRIWIAEMELDFKVAYHLASFQQGKMTAERSLRLIYLAQMAGANPEKHENDFLRLSSNRQLRASVIAARIQRSRKPEKEIKPFLKELAQTPEVLARLSLEMYSKTKNRQILEQAYDYPSVRKTPTGPIIGRLLYYKEFNVQVAKLHFHKLSIGSDKALKKSLEARIAMIKDLEKIGQRTISAKDVVMQAITLNILRNENERLHNDILKLPMPRGLKADQKVQYQALVAQQAQPYMTKASQIETKLKALWANGSWSDQLAQNYTQARKEYKAALRQDIEQLMAHAPNDNRQTLAKALAETPNIPSEKAVYQVRAQVQKNPFETSYVTELKDLESRRGNDVAAAHLQARLNQMKGSQP